MCEIGHFVKCVKFQAICKIVRVILRWRLGLGLVIVLEISETIKNSHFMHCLIWQIAWGFKSFCRMTDFTHCLYIYIKFIKFLGKLGCVLFVKCYLGFKWLCLSCIRLSYDSYLLIYSYLTKLHDIPFARQLINYLFVFFNCTVLHNMGHKLITYIIILFVKDIFILENYRGKFFQHPVY